jgi:hypothetical protein
MPIDLIVSGLLAPKPTNLTESRSVQLKSNHAVIYQSTTFASIHPPPNDCPYLDDQGASLLSMPC